MPSYGQGAANAHAAPTAYGTATEHGQATLAFILGIISVVMLPLLGPVAWVLGRKAVKQIDASPGTYRNRGIGVAGMVLGIVGTVFLVVLILGSIAFVAIFVMAAAQS